MRIFLSFLFFCNALLGIAQQDTLTLPKLKSYVRNINTFNSLFPQEKVYLHFDNTGYFKGETIWFKAYVIRPDTLGYTNLSRTLYVELISPVGEIVEKRTLVIKNGQAHGDMKLDGTMPPGFYEIRAYTRYMMNWDAACIFSRVFPVFGKPEKEKPHKIPLGIANAKRDAVADKDITEVRFYPEGGWLVKGIPNRVAFEVNEAAALSNDTLYGYLLSETGDTLSRIKTESEGRGLFSYVPGEEKLHLVFPNQKGKSKYYILPQAKDTGCVMQLDAVYNPDFVQIEFSSSLGFQNKILGWTILHNGSVLFFDTLSLSHTSVVRKIPSASLPAGVSQVTLFDSDGRIWSERLFFIAPRDSMCEVERIVITAPQKITPYGKMDFKIQAPPKTTFSLSVMDAKESVNGDDGNNAATWLLLSSDLKGFIRGASRYLESGDKAHRSRTDLLMMVQGWRRYDWSMMAGRKTFVKRQPIEDGLYLDGQLKRNRQDYDVENVKTDVILMNPSFRRGSKWMAGEFVTKEEGYFAFNFSEDVFGKWDLVFSTRKDNKAQKYKITVDRRYSPPVKNKSISEITFAKMDTADTRVVAPYFEPYDSLLFLKGQSHIKLRPVIVKEKKRKEEFSRTARDIEIEKKLKGGNLIYYNCAEVADEMEDKGEDIPYVWTWLLDKPYLYNEVINKKRMIVWMLADEIRYVTNTLDGPSADKPPIEDLDELRSIYVDLYSGKRKVTRLQSTYAEESDKLNLFGGARFSNGLANCIVVYLFPRYMLSTKKKGVRVSKFQGYHIPQTFEMNDYSIMPPEDDYRRTLYWNPNVKTDSKGRATVTVWNNSICRQLFLSAEGITSKAKPMINQ